MLDLGCQDAASLRTARFPSRENDTQTAAMSRFRMDCGLLFPCQFFAKAAAPKFRRSQSVSNSLAWWPGIGEVMLGKFAADALCLRAWRPPCSPMGRLASPSAPAPPWSSSAIVRTSRSTSRSKSPRSACQSLRAANRQATRNERNTSPCRASSPLP